MDEDSGAGLLSKSASAYEHLKRLAVRGMLRPNRRLAPSDLASHFQISITPVRDALVRLAAEGFIRSEMGRGYFTKTWSVEEQGDLQALLAIHFVASLEAGREHGLSAPRPLADLGVSISGLESAQGAEAFVEALEELHIGSARRAGNAAALHVVRNAIDRTQRVTLADLEAPERRAAVLRLLGDVVDAVTGADLPRAIEAARAHLGQIVERLPELVARANTEAQRVRFP